VVGTAALHAAPRVCCAAEYTLTFNAEFSAIRPGRIEPGTFDSREPLRISTMPAVRHTFRPRSAAAAMALALLAAAAPGVAVAQSDPPAGSTPAGVAARAEQPRASPALTADLMYRLLIGDIALQRGEPALAARAYYEAAREAKDPLLARRATEIAVAARQRGLAVDAARLWSELDPTAERPKQVVAATGGAGTSKSVEIVDDELKSQIEKALAQAAATPAALADAFLQLNHLLAQEPDKVATYKLVTALAAAYPNVPEAHFAVALAALNTGLKEIGTRAAATREVDRALALKPGWERAILLKSEVIGSDSPVAAIDYLAGVVKADPAARAAWGALAQLYVEQKRYAEARAVFQRLWDEDKSAREYEFGIAALSVQMKDWATAEKVLQDLKRAGYGENGIVEFYLAQVAEESGNLDLAIERYRTLPEGERAWQGQLRIATVMGKQKRVDEARKYLRDLPVVTLEQKIQVRQTEAQLLRDTGDNAGAYAVLTQALGDHPDDPDLLYDTAMVAEKLDRLDVAEAHLKRLVELTPENAQALNALGYTLVDRTPRAAEGYALIEKALKLSPEDPFIQDSMGWALYRMGKLDDAETYLRRAMAGRPDAEIAAHLGEVLWVKGDRATAREVWQSQLKATPDNQMLIETVRRLAP
jgi:tetratricopeptide (TPR) repeat protein